MLRHVASGWACLSVSLGVKVYICSAVATAPRSDLYVHWPDLSSLILPHPQLSVFGRVHTLQELVHRLHRLDKARTAVSWSVTVCAQMSFACLAKYLMFTSQRACKVIHFKFHSISTLSVYLCLGLFLYCGKMNFRLVSAKPCLPNTVCFVRSIRVPKRSEIVHLLANLWIKVIHQNFFWLNNTPEVS